MINFINGYNLIWLALFIGLGWIIFNKVIKYRVKQYIETNRTALLIRASIMGWLPIIVFFLFVYIQKEYNIFRISQIDNQLALVISILTLYGIYYAFIQFAISYSVKNEKDWHWGKSITNFKLTNNHVFKIFNSRFFRFLLIYIVIISLVDIGNLQLNENPLTFKFKNITWDLLLSEWAQTVFAASIVTVMLVYILLFVTSLSIMNDLFRVREGIFVFEKHQIENSIINDSYLVFKQSYKNTGPVFSEYIFETIKLSNEPNKKEIFIKIMDRVVNKYQYNLLMDKKNLKQLNHYHNLFKRMLHRDEVKVFDLSFNEIFHLYRSMERYILVHLKETIDENEEYIDGLIHLYGDRDRTLSRFDLSVQYYDMPKIIWDKVESFDQLQKIQILVDQKVDTIEECIKVKGLGDTFQLFEKSYGKYTYELLIHLSKYMHELDINKGQWEWTYFSLFGRDHLHRNPIKNKIYTHIIDSNINDENKLHIELLLQQLPYKDRACFIFYLIMYPNDSMTTIVENGLFLFAEVMQSNIADELVNLEELQEYIISKITKENSYFSHIKHQIGEEEINWIFDHLNVDAIDESYIKVCINSPNIKNLKMLQLRYVFNLRIDYQIDFSQMSSYSLKRYPTDIDWRLVFALELMNNSGFIKDEYCKMYLLKLLSSINQNEVLTDYLRLDDIRLYIASKNLYISKADIKKNVIKYNIPSGLMQYLIMNLNNPNYKYLLEDGEISAKFLPRLQDELKNDDIEEYLEKIFKRLEEVHLESLMPEFERTTLVVKLKEMELS